MRLSAHSMRTVGAPDSAAPPGVRWPPAPQDPIFHGFDARSCLRNALPPGGRAPRSCSEARRRRGKLDTYRNLSSRWLISPCHRKRTAFHSAVLVPVSLLLKSAEAFRRDEMGDTKMNQVTRRAARSALLATAGTAALLLAAQAAQADTAAADATATGPTTSVGEVVVTAQRRSQNIQEVPESVQAISSRQLIAAGIKSTQDLGRSPRTSPSSAPSARATSP